LDPPAGVRRAPARRTARRAAAAVAGRDGGGLGDDGRAWERLFAPFLREPHALLADLLAPAPHPEASLPHGSLRAPGLLPATTLFRARFRGERARALLAAARPFHPAARAAAHRRRRVDLRLYGPRRRLAGRRGGSGAIGDALASYLPPPRWRDRDRTRVSSLADVPPARVVLFDTSPAQLADIGAPVLPDAYVTRLRRYRYGPGAFKLDWALDGPIPWRDPRCLEASTVHLGGTLDEIAAGEAAVWRGEHPERPFVLLVQQSQFDPARARRAGTRATRTATCPQARPSIRQTRSSDRSNASRRASASASSRGT
jgi:phytoene dehydrogenase-like protein